MASKGVVDRDHLLPPNYTHGVCSAYMKQHPAIQAEIDKLAQTLKDLTEDISTDVELLKKTLHRDTPDVYGIKMRSSSIGQKAMKISWLSAKLDALQAVPYLVAAHVVEGAE